MEEIEFSWWFFEGRLRQGKNVLPDRLNWLCYFAGSSKSHCENLISFIFLQSPHQADVKNVIKSYKHFFGYFNSLETRSDKPACLLNYLGKFFHPARFTIFLPMYLFLSVCLYIARLIDLLA